MGRRIISQRSRWSLTVLENLTAEHQHRDIVVAFVPDEGSAYERSQRRWILSALTSTSLWTIGCCRLGEIVYENFNAAAAEIRFTGVTAHPMSQRRYW